MHYKGSTRRRRNIFKTFSWSKLSILWIFIRYLYQIGNSLLDTFRTTAKRYWKVVGKNISSWQKVENCFMNTFQLPVAACQLFGTLLACSLSCIASKPSRRLRSDGNVRWQQQRQLLATLPNRNAMKSIIFPRSVCVACHQPPSTSLPLLLGV